MAKNSKILHLMGWDKKFVPSFIQFVSENFDRAEHRFIVHGDVPEGEFSKGQGVIYLPHLLRAIRPLMADLRDARKVIIHGMFSSHLLYLLTLQPWLLKKCCWVIWGGDLYVHHAKEKNWRWQKNEIFRRFVIKRFGLITTTVPGDYDMARLWYSARAPFIQNLMYPSHIARIANAALEEQRDLVVQIGNSADPSNNHFEIIDRLVALSFSRNIKVTAPLSYGDMNYAKQVIEYARLKLGNIFTPITHFMDFDDYNKYMETVSIVIFNHKRQQAIGNTIGLLSLGKKVYLRSDVTPWEYLKSLGLHIYDSTSDISLEKISPIIAKSNIDICRYEFSISKLVNAWHQVFES